MVSVGNSDEMVEKEENFLDGIYTPFVSVPQKPTAPQKRPLEEVNDTVSSKTNKKQDVRQGKQNTQQKKENRCRKKETIQRYIYLIIE